MTCLTVQVDLSMRAGLPFICGGLVASGADRVICSDRHGIIGMTLLHGPMTSLAGNTLFRIPACVRIKTGGVALETGRR
jgi:hypothetical protein